MRNAFVASKSNTSRVTMNNNHNLQLSAGNTNKSMNIEFMPFTILKPLIEGHPIVSTLHISHTELHSMMVHVFTAYKHSITKRCRPQMIEDEGSSAHSVLINKCAHCDSNTMIIDSTRGDRVCGNCGGVKDGIVYGRSYEDEIGHVPERDTRSHHLWEDIHRINTCMFLSDHDVSKMIFFTTFITSRTSDNIRIAVGFLMLYLDQHYDMRTLDFSRDSPITFQTSSTIYTCSKCGDTSFTKSDRGKHKCYRPQARKQWSLAQNKRSQMKHL